MKYLIRIIYSLVILLLANFYAIQIYNKMYLVSLVILYIFINIHPYFSNKKLPSLRLRSLANGCELIIIFLISTVLTVSYLLTFIIRKEVISGFSWIIYILPVIVIETVVFWNGIIRIYMTSEQLAIKWRVIGIVCGWMPVIHLIVLNKIIMIISYEIVFESEKIFINMERHDKEICCTKYPILLVHGVFFRDFKYFDYWGRIPEELKYNGAVIYYGKQQSASSIIECGTELNERIHKIVEETGCEKVNIIAHSKGGLDCRYAISKLGADKYVASLTTINTPHRGCMFADYLLSKIPQKTQVAIAEKYNSTLKKLGDKDPDFLSAVKDLTSESSKKFNDNVLDAPGILYQSIGSKLNKALSGRFPLNLSYRFVKYFDGDNDGLVSCDSFVWGERNEFLNVKGNRGISHGDMIDLNRENINEFDVREFYVNLVYDLKKHGY